MWVLSWKKYKLSKFATFVSVIGALVRYGAVMCICASLIPGFVVCALIGIGLHFCAEYINTGKWQKLVTDQGYTQKIAAGDLQAAIAVYNANPKKQTLKFIGSFNPQMEQEVRARIEKK